ncbi:hypothetical protein Syun_024040 [Stephania yunnanensis]|uniref:Homeobox-leucine zipper protein n=1 Tax=Stephania yunnanensis TaxID=152371 RepID=A0AAP0I3X9_9MAGN
MDSGGRVFFNGSCHGSFFFMGNNNNNNNNNNRSSSNVDPLFRVAGAIKVSMEEGSSKRRPFFTTCSSSSTSDELLFDDEFYDEQLPEKKRRLTPDQVQMLEKSFETENKLEPERKTQLAKKLGLQPRQVAVWFQNRRARWKTKQMERDYDLLKASYDSLLSDFRTISKDTDNLKSQVTSLTEKLQAKEAEKSGAEDAAAAGVVEDMGGVQLELELVLDTSVGGGESYFHDGYGGGGMESLAPTSEEDDGSDDGRSYFSDVFEAVEHGRPPGDEDGDGDVHLGGWWETHHQNQTALTDFKTYTCIN